MTLPSSYHRANNVDDGPFRKVVRTEVLANGNIAEVLECGHRGKVASPAWTWWKPGKRRRCWACRANPSTPPVPLAEPST